MSQNKENKEIEVRFLEIDALKLKKKLKELGAKDEGTNLLTASIFYDKEMTWRKNGQSKFVRLRRGGGKTMLTYKNFLEVSPTGTEEIEIEISDIGKAKEILEKIGLFQSRIQEKKRHKFSLKGVIFDFDTWPKVPTFLEIEAPSELKLKKAAESLGLSWKDAVSGNVGSMIERVYKIPVLKLSFYTFKKIK